jgi:hypothetical protein
MGETGGREAIRGGGELEGGGVARGRGVGRGGSKVTLTV